MPGLSEAAKREFWEYLDGMVRGVPSSEKLFIGGDFHGHVGTTSGGFERVASLGSLSPVFLLPKLIDWGEQGA